MDIDGVVLRGARPIDGAVETVKELLARGYRVGFITNDNETTREACAAKLQRHGFPVTAATMMTAGAVAAEFARTHLTGVRVLVVGTDALVSSFVDAGIEVVPLERYADADAVVMGKDLAFNYDKLRLAARAAARTGRFYATNLDPQMPVEDTFDPGSGAMIMAVAYAARVEPQVLGKPSRHAAEMAAGLLGLPVTDIAMVGDAPAQDIAMGRAAGMRTALVLTGIARADAVETLPPEHRPDLVLGSLSDILGLL